MKQDHWNRAKFSLRVGLVGALVLAAGYVGCSKAKEALPASVTAAANMTFSGTVSRVGSAQPIKGATVSLIPLASATAIQSLVEAKNVPDGKGGKTPRLRIKLDKVQSYIAANSGSVVKATTDEKGKFTAQAPVNIYLVYTSGPGSAPGAADAYNPHFWGINAETGELDKDHLIGKDLKLTQTNDKILLAGGPVSPPPAPAAAPQPKATPPVPPTSTTTPTTTQAEPKTGDTLPRGNIVPPTPATSFWKSVKLTYSSGSIGTGSALQVDTAALPDGQRYLEITGELVTAQTTPVYLVIQKGIDSTYVANCSSVTSQSTTRVYPVTVNGTTISYQLVPPGPYYKFYLAKTATQATPGDVPSTVDSPSDTLTVGRRECAFATPERPFLATLTWDQQVDLDLHVAKFDAAKVAAATTKDQIGLAMVDSSDYTRRQGQTLSLDVDNVYGYGPENNGDSKDEQNPGNYCYLVTINYYAGAAANVNANVDVTYVDTSTAGSKVIKQIPSKVVLAAQGDWQTVGAYGPTACAKLMSPPPDPAEVMAYPSASACVSPASCDLKGDQAGKFTPTVTLEKTSFTTADTVKVTYANMPDYSGNWVTIVPKANPDNSWCSWQWAASKSGTQVYGSLPAGDYEVRLYYNWTGGSGSGGGQCEVIGRQAFSVK